MSDDATTIAELRTALAAFNAERDWEPYHAPKNLAMALAVEAAELMELFLWVDAEPSRRLADDPDTRTAIADELADVANHVFNLANSLNLDLSDAVRAKLAKNAIKYPAKA